MKKILVLLFICSGLQAEAQRNKEIQVRAGLGFAVYGTETEFTVKNGGFSYTEKDKDGAVTLHLPLDLRFELNEKWNLGLNLKFGSYLYDPDSAEGKSNRFVVLGLNGEYNLVSMDNFRWYLGLGIHGTSLLLEENYSLGSIKYKDESTYGGAGIKLNTGVLIYILGPLGFNFNLGYDSHSFTLNKLERNGQEINLDNFEGKLKTRGLDGTLGLVVRL